MSNDNVSQVFWAAAGSEPLPVVETETKSSCCGTQPATDTTKAATPKASSCCSPKPAEEKEKVEAVAAKSSCC